MSYDWLLTNKKFLFLTYFFRLHNAWSSKKRCCVCTASVKKLKPVLFSLTVPGNVPGLERAYEALGITLATNGEPRLQPYPGKKSLADFVVFKSLICHAMLN